MPKHKAATNSTDVEYKVQMSKPVNFTLNLDNIDTTKLKEEKPIYLIQDIDDIEKALRKMQDSMSDIVKSHLNDLTNVITEVQNNNIIKPIIK